MPASLQDHKTHLSQAYLEDESKVISRLLPLARLPYEQAEETKQRATYLIESVRGTKRRITDLNNFLQEYDLSSEEGIALMCVAETLLRIPDSATADQLIREKIGGASWQKKLENKSPFLSAAQWGLQLTGEISRWGEESSPGWGHVGRAVARLGEPVIRAALKSAMGLMGKQFILGETIQKAIKNSEKLSQQGYRFSYDMLGEAAKTQEDADRYYQSYKDAIYESGQAGNT